MSLSEPSQMRFIKAPAPSDATNLFERIRNRDASAESELYLLIGRAIQAKWEAGIDNQQQGHHEIFMAILQAIRDHTVREPASLISYMRTLFPRRHTTQIDDLTRGRSLPGIHAVRSLSKADIDVKLHNKIRRPATNRDLKSIAFLERIFIIRYYDQRRSAERSTLKVGISERVFGAFKATIKKQLVDNIRSLAQPKPPR